MFRVVRGVDVFDPRVNIVSPVGLARMFAGSARLRAACNLFIVGGDAECGRSGSKEEKEEDDEEEEEDESVRLAREMLALFDSGELNASEARWVSAQSNPVSNGELYRVDADARGALVLPTRFENFGLTVVESMASGVPTFATQNGGCSEIIKHG